MFSSIYREGFDDRWVELRPGAAEDLRQGLVARAAAAVDAVGRHRVEGVRDEDDPSADGDLGPGEAVGISASVPSFVVMQHPLRDGIDAETLEHSKSNLSVLPEGCPLRLGQLLWLAEEIFGESELADVVEARGELCELELFARQAEARGQSNSKLRDALRMVTGVDVSRIDRSGEACRGS